MQELNEQLARKESFERLLDIYAHFCPKSFTIHNRHLKFTKHDLLQHKRVRQLIHCDGQVRIWSATRRKLFQVLCLILNDMIVFLRFEPAAPVAVAAAAPQPLDVWLLDSTSGQQQLSSVPSSTAPATATSTPGNSLSLHQYPLQQPEAANQQQQQAAGSGEPSGGGESSFRYYFANIDNKSSVISLSKLLIREKAAHDQEPRIYLISSNPRQPEMYELAFASKRHLAGFVEKLKTSIEQHNKKVAAAMEDEFGSAYHHDPYVAEDYEYGGDDCDERQDDGGDDDLIELNFEDCDCCAICSQQNELELELDDDDDDEPQQEQAADFVVPQGTVATTTAALLDAARRGSPSRTNCRNTKSKSLRQKKQQEQQRRRDTIDGNCRLSPPNCPVAAAAAAHQSSVNHAEAGASSVYGEAEEPEAAVELDDDEASSSSSSTAATEDRLGLGLGLPLESSSSTGSADSGLSERAKDSLDEAAPSKQKLRGPNRRRRAQRPRNVSNQSSSSSEAAHRQAIELISVCKQLNRQQQHPSAAATANQNDEFEFDSGRGHDDSCCSSSSSSSLSSSSSSSSSKIGCDSPQKARSKSQPPPERGSGGCRLKEGAAAVGRNLEDQDQELMDLEPGDSMTSAVIIGQGSCPEARATLASAQPAGGGGSGCCQRVLAASSCGALVEQRQQQMVSLVSSSEGDADRAPPRTAQPNPSSCGSTNSSAVDGRRQQLECPEAAKAATAGGSSIVAADSSSSFSSQQRKLSNVSSMSSQLRLISRLKSGLEAAHHSSCSLARRVSSGAKSSSSLCRQQQQHRPPCDTTAAAAMLSKQMRQQMRRSSFVPEQKLEELRDLRIQLDKDKQEWQAKFNRMQEQLLNERRELDLAREQLKQDRQQVASEREQLYRKLDALKEKGILLSPSHKVIITAPEQQTALQQQQQLYSPLMCQQPPHYANNSLRLNHNQPQQQLIGLANNSIKIHHQQKQQQNICGQQSNGHQATMVSMQPRRLATTTNLFIQGSSSHHSRVPLHLSESSPPSIGAQQKQPLISVIGGNLFGVERLTGSSQPSSASSSCDAHQQQHSESHVI